MCEGGVDRRRSSTSHSVGCRCCERYHTRHRCAHGGPFPSIIHLSLSPIGARVISLPPRPPFPLLASTSSPPSSPLVPFSTPSPYRSGSDRGGCEPSEAHFGARPLWSRGTIPCLHETVFLEGKETSAHTCKSFRRSDLFDFSAPRRPPELILGSMGTGQTVQWT